MTSRHSIKDLVCVNCGISFHTSHKRRYCCVACRNASKSGHTRRHICQHCANEFEGRKRKYCSSDCEAKAKRERDDARRPNKTGRARRQPTPIIDGRRECLGCGEVKALKSFRECANAGSGYASTCKDCFRGYAAIRASKRTKEQRRAERERAVAKQGRTLFSRRSLPPTQRQIDVLIKRNAIDAWRYWINQKAPDWWVKEYTQSMRREAYRRQHAAILANPERLANYRFRKNLKKQARAKLSASQQDKTLSVKTIQSLLIEYEKCIYCGIKLTSSNRTLDHMQPLTLGGPHSICNIVVCCHLCNSNKRDKPFSDWLSNLDQVSAKRALKIYVKKRGGPPQQGSLQLFMA